MPKIIIVTSCNTCDLSFDSRIKLDCPCALALREQRPKYIHEKCPLEDYEEEE